MPGLVVSNSVNTWKSQAVWCGKNLQDRNRLIKYSYQIVKQPMRQLCTRQYIVLHELTHKRTSDLIVRMSLVIESIIDLQHKGENKGLTEHYIMKYIH